MADFSSSFVDLEQNLFDETEVDVMSFLCGAATPNEMDRGCLSGMDMEDVLTQQTAENSLYGEEVHYDENALLSAFLPTSSDTEEAFIFASSATGSPSSSSSPPSSPDAGESSPDVRSPLGVGADTTFASESFLLGSSLLFNDNLSGMCSGSVATISPSCLQPTIDLPQITEVLDDEEEEEDDSEDPAPEQRKTNRKRKRQRKNEEPVVKTAVTLPRKDLLKLSSKELDEYAERLRSVRTLSAAEEKDLRRQRRLIKNRESAQLSRQRRKVHMEDMQEQINQLASENTRLKTHAQALEIENTTLKAKLRSLLLQQDKSSSSPNAHDSNSTSSLATSSNEGSSFLQMMRDLTTVKKPLAATGGVVTTTLMIVLLSFGLLFMSTMNGGLSAAPAALAAPRATGFLTTGNIERSDVATVMPTFTSSYSPSSHATMRTDHPTAAATTEGAVESNNFQAHKKMRGILQVNEDLDVGSSPDRPIQIDDAVDDKHHSAYPSYDSAAARDAKELNASSEGTEPLNGKTSPLGGFLASASSALRRTYEHVVPAQSQQEKSPQLEDDLTDKMDVSSADHLGEHILWCPNARSLPSLGGGTAPSSGTPKPGSTLTLLVNKHTAFSASPHLTAQPSGVLQITCRVLDVSGSCALQQGLVSCSE